jgi:hypothetical protein
LAGGDWNIIYAIICEELAGEHHTLVEYRYYYQPHNFKLIVGCPQDARGLDWLFIQSQLKNIPIHRLANKQKVYDDEWYQEILHTLQRL